MTHRRGTCFAVFLTLAVSLSGPAPVRAGGLDDAVWVEGELSLAWATPAAGAATAAPPAATLHLETATIHLELTEHDLGVLGGPIAASGARVRALLPASAATDSSSIHRPLALERTAGEQRRTEAAGSYPYVSLMCKFSDVPAEPEDLSYFQNMYANAWPGLDHYWRRQSYDMVDVVGSTAAGWFTLPHPQSYYTGLISGSNYSPMLNALYDDCTAAAAGSVNLSSYVGINLMFNDTFGPYAWGGWGGVTWEPPWGWGNIAVIEHEMGHAFGLPHSNNADGDGNPYDNPWDVMSNSWGRALSDGTYGTVGKHTISYHKDRLGWIPAGRKAEVSTPGVHVFNVDHLTLAETDNLHLVTVPIPGTSRHYTIEVRDRVGYDGALEGFAVILHEIDPYRQEPAWLVDPALTDNGSGPGVMWLPGECYDDSAAEIVICVDSVTTEGYRVRVLYGDVGLVYADGFETGDTSAWSTANE